MGLAGKMFRIKLVEQLLLVSLGFTAHRVVCCRHCGLVAVGCICVRCEPALLDLFIEGFSEREIKCQFTFPLM